jgi:hypothetical protein
MLIFILGLVALLVLMGALGMFSRAQITTLKSAGVWALAIGGLLLGAMMLLTGRGGAAVSMLLLLGPLVWSWVAQAKPGGASAPLPGAMTRQEALDVLGLRAGATEAEIRAAHRRLMAAAHPDRGGSDWLAARINAARDTLLR